jgi:hypothetical protein
MLVTRSGHDHRAGDVAERANDGAGQACLSCDWESVHPSEARQQESMSAHKFKIGQFVNCNPRSNSIGAGLYQIAQLMPPAGDEPQYRIKSQVEDHLRAALESERRPFDHS